MTAVLATPRLRLRELEPADLDFVATMMAHPDVARVYARTFSRRDAEEWLQRQRRRYAADGHGLWLVSRASDDAPVGQVGLAMQDVEGVRQPEIGWLLHRPFWGHGYATEAAAAVRDAAFSRWRYRRVISLIRPDNVRSRRVAARIGMAAGRRVAFHGFEHDVFAVSGSPTEVAAS